MTGFGQAPSRSAWARRFSTAEAIAAGNYGVLRANAERIVAGVRAARGIHDERGAVSTARKVVTFGEIMLRLSPPGLERFFQTPVLSATFGGGEANVAGQPGALRAARASTSRLLPAHAIGEAAVRALRAEGVRTDHIVRSGSRVGIYFAETGASQRASTVIYDRAHSSISELAPDAIDWRTRPPEPPGSTSPASRRRWARTPPRPPRAPSSPRTRGGRARQLRPELPQEAVDRGRGAACGRAAPAERRSRRRQRRGPPVRARHRRSPAPTSRLGISQSTDSARRPSE